VRVHALAELLSRARAEWGALLAWWLQEMRACGESLLIRLAPRLITRTFVRLERAGGGIWTLRGKERRDLLTFTCEAPGDWPGDLQTSSSAEAIRGTRAVFALAPEFALVHRMILPDALERDLDRVIALQLERQQPMRLDRVCFAWHIVGRSRRQRLLTVEVLIAHRGCIERVQGLAQGWAVQPVRIGIVNASGGVTGNFVRRAARSRTFSLNGTEARLALSAALLAALGVLLIGGQCLYERVKVGQALTSAVTQAAVSDHLARDVKSVAIPAAALTDLMSQPDALDVLAVLTERIPADSWVYDLDITAQFPVAPEIKLAAFTPTATLLVDLLGTSGQFDHVQLVSAVSAGLGFGDRLQLTARWATESRKASSAPVAAAAINRNGLAHDPG